MRVGERTVVWHANKSVILDCEIGSDCVIHAPVWIGNGVKIGDRCKIQAFSFIPEGVVIGDDVFVGPNVTFTNDRYPPSDRRNWQGTVVGSGVSIGAGVVVCPGVTLHAGSRIGAGAVVTHDTDVGVHVGVPARKR